MYACKNTGCARDGVCVVFAAISDQRGRYVPVSPQSPRFCILFRYHVTNYMFVTRRVRGNECALFAVISDQSRLSGWTPPLLIPVVLSALRVPVRRSTRRSTTSSASARPSASSSSVSPTPSYPTIHQTSPPPAPIQKKSVGFHDLSGILYGFDSVHFSVVLIRSDTVLPHPSTVPNRT